MPHGIDIRAEDHSSYPGGCWGLIAFGFLVVMFIYYMWVTTGADKEGIGVISLWILLTLGVQVIFLCVYDETTPYDIKLFIGIWVVLIIVGIILYLTHRKKSK